MNKKYLYHFFLTFITHNTFGINKILVPELSKQTHQLVTNKLPKSFNPQNLFYSKKYVDMEPAMQYIVNYLRPEDRSNNIFFFDHIQKNKFSKNNNYFIIKLTKQEGITPNHYYCFKWEKKLYSKLKGLEKYVANYYGANKDSDLEFLYPYKRSDKNNVGQIDNNSWAIKIGNQRHSFLWQKATTKDMDNSIINGFEVVEIEDQNKSISLLVDENNHILAKSINGVISYKPI